MTERTDLRTAHAKIFDLAPGKMRVQVSPQVYHVPDDPAAWQRGDPVAWEDVEHDFDQVAGAYRLRRSWCALDIPTDAIGYRYRSRLTGGTLEVTLVQLGTTPVSDLALPAPRLDPPDIWWDNVVPGLDIYAKVRPGRIELFKRLRSASVPRRFRWRIVESLPARTPLTLETAGHDNADLAEPARAGTGPGRRRRQVQMLHAIGPDDLTSRPGFRIFTVDERWTGKTIALDANRVPSLSDDVVFPVLIDQDITETIVAVGDDGHQRVNGSWYDQSGGSGDHVIYSNILFPAYRLQTVAVPQGATIDAATLTMTVASSGGSAGSGAVLYGNDVDDAPVWVNYGGPNEMPKTTATAVFGAWGGSTTGAQAISVTAIVQEIINRAGWVSGNDMAFGVQGTMSPAGAYSYIHDLNGGSSNIAVLTIDYTAGGAAVTPPLPFLFQQVRQRRVRRLAR